MFMKENKKKFCEVLTATGRKTCKKMRELNDNLAKKSCNPEYQLSK